MENRPPDPFDPPQGEDSPQGPPPAASSDPQLPHGYSQQPGQLPYGFGQAPPQGYSQQPPLGYTQAPYGQPYGQQPYNASPYGAGVYGQPTRPQQSVISVMIGILLIVLCLVLICSGSGNLLSGALVGVFEEFSTEFESQMREELGSDFEEEFGSGFGAEFDASIEQLQQLSEISDILLVFGLISVILGIAALVIAIAVFLSKSWGYAGTIIVLGGYVVLQLVSIVILGAFGPGPLGVILSVFAVIGIILFLANDDVRRQFGQFDAAADKPKRAGGGY